MDYPDWQTFIELFSYSFPTLEKNSLKQFLVQD